MFASPAGVQHRFRPETGPAILHEMRHGDMDSHRHLAAGESRGRMNSGGVAGELRY